MKEDAHILIAEDDDDDFFFFRRAVRAASIDCPILRFRDGAEFVKFAQELVTNPADEPLLFFIDISMPVMSGFDVLRWLREQKGRLNVKPIVLSGSNRQEDMTKARELGAIDYLVKPLATADVVRYASGHLKSQVA